METILFCLFILISTQLFAQEIGSNLDIRFGVGRSLLGSGDMRTTMLENELNYQLNRFFTTAASVGYGRSDQGVYETVSFIRGNLNVFFSPFKNTGTNDFRIGGGLSFCDVPDARRTLSCFEEDETNITFYEFDERQSLGFNAMIENTYAITNRLLLGLKLFAQPYFNGDINSGILFKTGVRL